MRETAYFDLDSTLRFIYSTFRNKNYTMAIEFKHNGRIWRADTAEEAIALRKELEEEDDIAAVTGEDPRSLEGEDVWRSDEVVDLLKTSGDLQKQFIKFLFEKGEKQVPSSEIIKALKIGSEEALAGVLSGLSKRLKKVERQPSELYRVSVQWVTDGKIRRFGLTHGFRWAATQLGWPDKWI